MGRHRLSQGFTASLLVLMYLIGASVVVGVGDNRLAETAHTLGTIIPHTNTTTGRAAPGIGFPDHDGVRDDFGMVSALVSALW